MKAIITLILGLSLCSGFAQTLSVQPGTVRRGQNGLSLLFSGSGVNFRPGSNTNLTHFQQGTTTLYPVSTFSNSSNTMTGVYDIPSTTPCGSYDLFFGQGSNTLFVSNALTVTCSSQIDSTIYSASPLLCNNRGLMLSIIRCAGCTCLWSTGDTSPTTTIDTLGSYSVTITDGVDTVISRYEATAYDSIFAHYSLVRDTTTSGHWFVHNECWATSPMVFLWSWGDGSPDDTGAYPSHTYINPGNYEICVWANDSRLCWERYCDSSTYIYRSQSMVRVTVVRGVAAGISEAEASAFSIYPSPSESILNVSSDQLDITEMVIYDMTGNLLKTQNNNGRNAHINTAEMPSGVYLLRIKTAQGELMRRFSVIH